MQLHTLAPHHKTKPKKRIGRGGKRGTYSGRGMKGQKARSGHRIRPAIRDFLGRLPKLRGQTFKAQNQKPIAINLDFLARNMKTNVISRKTLLAAGFGRDPQNTFKILGNGAIDRAITVKGLSVSRSAREKIVAAGGKIE